MRILEFFFLKIYFFMRLSMLYIALCACGLFVFGFSPANATMMYLYKRNRDKVEKYHWKDAFSYFKEHFVLSNSMAFLIMGIAAVFFASLWAYLQLPPTIWVLMGLSIQAVALLLLFCIYGVYLQLQCYYTVRFLLSIRLALIGIFLDIWSLVKWLIGSGICFFLFSKVSLLVAVFIPVVWLLFTADVLEPIYRKIEERVQT
ncbi:DUF624 domain-containing protein [Streptococcus cuniculi]|uniref:DUF624 domain-containing protein n=2 Tax=Streptococcus cuniculi TaxID=1432788 RepID=A0A4Y9J8R2_9STRE|nr:DUF624 domain-containing protein [Streptococcus cuniculi]